mgnify:CR=1 FL=1
MPTPPPDVIVWHISALHTMGHRWVDVFDDVLRLHAFVVKSGLPHLMLINGAHLLPGNELINKRLVAMQEAVLGLVGGTPTLDVFRATLRWRNTSMYSPACPQQDRRLTCLIFYTLPALQRLRWGDLRKDRKTRRDAVFAPAHLTLAAIWSAVARMR